MCTKMFNLFEQVSSVGFIFIVTTKPAISDEVGHVQGSMTKPAITNTSWTVYICLLRHKCIVGKAKVS